MLFIAFARSIVGILFVVRTMHVFRRRALVSGRAIEITGLGALILIGLIEFFDDVSGVATGGALIALVATALAPAVVFIAVERNQIARFRARVPLFLDRWILNLRLGSSVGAARAAALRAEIPPVRALLAPVFEGDGEGRRKHLILAPAVLRELEIVARSAHAALERLEALRSHVRESDDFRRKSGLAVRQATIQSAVMWLMLIALGAYTIRRHGWAHSGAFVTAAGALSIIGTLVMLTLARKKTWTL